MKKLVPAIVLGFTMAAQAATFTEAQAKEICRMVDPTFVKNVAVAIELKATGKERRHVIAALIKSGYYAPSGTAGTLYLTQLEEVFDAKDVTTVAQAIKLTEDNCFKKVSPL